MSTFTATEYKAVAWYAQEHGMRLTLMQRPYAFFDDGGETPMGLRLSSVVAQFFAHRRQQAHTRRRAGQKS